MTLYAATTNPGKLRDFARAAEVYRLGDEANPATAASIRIEPLPALAAIPAPDEDGQTFDANARLKAVYYSLRAPSRLVLADDSGLEVDALNGAPGVRSARYAADSASPIDRPGNTISRARSETVILSAAKDPCISPLLLSSPLPLPVLNPIEDTLDNRNNAALLHALASVPNARRQARYRCVLALARDGQVLITAEGSVEGRILTAARGSRGFGYDPLFLLPHLDRTMAELPPADRLACNHRGRALTALIDQIALL